MIDVGVYGVPRVFVCSPFRGATVAERETNEAYARRAMLDAVWRMEAPFAPHLLYPQILPEDTLGRASAMTCGKAYLARSSYVTCYLDRGCSPGMREELRLALALGVPIRYRTFGGREMAVELEVSESFSELLHDLNVPHLWCGPACLNTPGGHHR